MNRIALIIVVWLAGCWLLTPASSQTAQETVEKTIGSLVVQNASCSAQTMALNGELQKVRAELADLKAKQTAPANGDPDALKDAKPGIN